MKCRNSPFCCSLFSPPIHRGRCEANSVFYFIYLRCILLTLRNTSEVNPSQVYAIGRIEHHSIPYDSKKKRQEIGHSINNVQVDKNWPPETGRNRDSLQELHPQAKSDKCRQLSTSFTTDPFQIQYLMPRAYPTPTRKH